jgi:pimeloyl-ACP methyl ester carboxylesterase
MRENRGVRVATYRAPNFVFTEHEFELPLNHSEADGPTITVFAREVVLPAREHDDLPWLVFLQGGPGHEATRLLKLVDQTWWDRALKDYRLLLLDQRGTGRSSPVGSLPGLSPQEQADYLTHFRADSIVRDAEAIRAELAVEKWSVLGQSFGGFCVVNYLSQAPEGLAEAFITGGLPPLDRHPDEVYRATYERARAKNHAYYERYPADRDRVLQVVERLESEDVRLPSGDRLTERWFRQVGHVLGMSYGPETVHYILELPFGSPAFLHDVERSQPFPRNPLYAVIHEACYAPGVSTRWSAERVFPDDLRAEPTFLTGEHIYPWMFEEYGSLRPLAEAARILADHEWPDLYDGDRLAQNEVPVAAAIYAEDMYVPREFSEETGKRIRGLRVWLTNEYEHDGLRANGERVLGRLFDLLQGHA